MIFFKVHDLILGIEELNIRRIFTLQEAAAAAVAAATSSELLWEGWTSSMAFRRGSNVCSIDHDSADVQLLQERFPTCRRSELIRFLSAAKGDVRVAAEKYVRYVEWKSVTFPIVLVSVSDAVLHSPC